MVTLVEKCDFHVSSVRIIGLLSIINKVIRLSQKRENNAIIVFLRADIWDWERESYIVLTRFSVFLTFDMD